jgi:hypothetical protein
MTTPTELEGLRSHVTATVQHATDLLADLESIDEAFQVLLPSLATLTDAEREALVARLCGYDAALPERLGELVEGLADVLAGLTTADRGQAWLQTHLTRLQAGEAEEVA